jgi:hypothetical protein
MRGGSTRWQNDARSAPVILAPSAIRNLCHRSEIYGLAFRRSRSTTLLLGGTREFPKLLLCNSPGAGHLLSFNRSSRPRMRSWPRSGGRSTSGGWSGPRSRGRSRCGRRKISRCRRRTRRRSRGSTCRRSRRRRWAAAYRRKDIHPAPTIDIVWRARIAALGVTDMHSRVVQRVATSRKLVAQTWDCVPQQGHGSGYMRSGHRGAAEIPAITTVARVDSRASIRTRSSDIGLYSPASVSCNRTTAAKAGYGVGAGVQRAHRIGRLVNSGRIFHGGTTRPGVLRGRAHHDTGSSLCFNSSLQRVK